MPRDRTGPPRSGLPRGPGTPAPVTQLDRLALDRVGRIAGRILGYPYVSDLARDAPDGDYGSVVDQIIDEAAHGLGLGQAAHGRQDIDMRMPGEAVEAEGEIAVGMCDHEESQAAIRAEVFFENRHEPANARIQRPRAAGSAGMIC